MKHLYCFTVFTLLLNSFFFIGCAGRYFRPSVQQALKPKHFALSEWPYREYWTGIVFNGKRVGFSHFRLAPVDEKKGLYDIHSEAYLRVRLLMFDKTIKLKSFDRVAVDLSLVRFRYTYDLDGNRLQLRGQAFKVKTRLHGHTVTSWLDDHGRPLLEMSLGGVFIAVLENKKNAQNYLTAAALNKDETLLDFSLIKSNITIDNPGDVKSMKIELSGIDESFNIPSDQRQQCRISEDKHICRTHTQIQKTEKASPSVDPSKMERYLQPSLTVPSGNPLIHQTAEDIINDTLGTLNRVRSIFDWLGNNIEQKPVDVFTALDVLAGRKAECQGHSLLYAAFARAAEIPTRVVNGVVYSKNHRGFLYHTWAESLIDDRWMAVDHTLRQLPAHATHINLIEGDRMSHLWPLVDLIGHIEIEIIALDN